MKKLILAILFCASTSFGAATRYYLPSSGAAAVSPAFDAWWGVTSSAVRIKMVSAKSNTALTDQSIATVTTDVTLFKQFVSDPIGVVNFNTTTVSWVIRGSATANLCIPSASLRLYHSGGTFTTLLASADFDTGFGVTAATRILSGAALANVSSQNNDRIVFEIGDDNTSAGNRTVVERFGDPSATADFALTSGLTTDLDPWIEFSVTIPAATATKSGGLLQIFPCLFTPSWLWDVYAYSYSRRR